MKVQIQSTLTNHSGQILDVIYSEGDPFASLDGKVLKDVHAFCFYNGQLVIVYAESKKYWTPPGGEIEKEETYEEAVVREVKEETNMKVIFQKLIGFQDIYEPERIVRQTRSFCIVEPYDDFIFDPNEEITAIKLISPNEYKKYFNWGKIGERIMEKALVYNNEFTQTSS